MNIGETVLVLVVLGLLAYGWQQWKNTGWSGRDRFEGMSYVLAGLLGIAVFVGTGRFIWFLLTVLGGLPVVRLIERKLTDNDGK